MDLGLGLGLGLLLREGEQQCVFAAGHE